MSLEQKMDDLIVALNKNTEAHLAGKPETAPAAGKPGRKPAADKAAPTSVHTADEVKAKFEAIKTADSKQTPALKKIIVDQGFPTMAELLLNVDKLDSTYDALIALEESLGGGEAEDDL